MTGDVDVAAVAAAIGDPTRAKLLETLLTGVALPAGELAQEVRTSRTNASGHLAVLNNAGLVAVEGKGRRRYYRLASSEVAQALESLAVVARPRRVTSLREANAIGALRSARTCYDHLAGRLGVAVTAALVAEGTLIEHDEGYELTEGGRQRLCSLGVDLPWADRQRRPLARRCLDWSERRPHVAGAIGAALLEQFLQSGWIVRLAGGRAVSVTEAGQRALARELGMSSLPASARRASA